MAESARRLAFVLAGCLAALPLAADERAAAPLEEGLDIPFSKFVLDNGLTLVVHEDHKAPIVAVNVWYHVGSKNEKPGRTGFAHLFEHLMFNGSENFNDDYFKPFDRIGATGMNGTTNFDRTNYFQVVPKNALDVALWMESDRMGHLLGAIDQAKLDEQRGVVQNEKRQGENQPYGTAFRTIFENTYPAGHPYSWSVIGSMEDLDAAKLEDVHEWFRRYYGAANAVLVIAGDVDADEARKKVERYFGDIPSGPPVERYTAWVAKRDSGSREVMQDRVPQARIYKAWNIPEWGTDAALLMDLISDILTEGKNSRLYERLVYRDQIATSVNSFAYSRELGGLFILWVTAQPGQDLHAVELALDEELARFLADGPTQIEVDRVRSTYRADFIRGIERIGGFGGKSDILAQNEVYGGDPAAYQRDLRRVASVQPSFLRHTANAWLGDGAFVLEVHPFPDYSTSESAIDRSAGPPTPGDWPEVRFPERSRIELSNGLDVILARRTAVPAVEFYLMLDAGYAADPKDMAGRASLAMDLLDEGTKTRNTLQISQELALLGAELSTDSDLDTSVVELSALRAKLDRSLELYADIVLHPAFSQSEFDRLKKERIAQVKREKASPNSMALRALPRLLYGEGHAYSAPLTGTGTEQSLERMTVEDVVDFHKTWFDPARATLIVVGDTTLEELQPKIEKAFGEWSAGKPKKKKISSVKRTASGLYLIDRPDSLQSTIIVGRLAPPRSAEGELAVESMNAILGGSFTARINMNLREDKHWSYGARSRILDAAAQRPFYISAPVQTDKTVEAITEIRNELNGIRGEHPPTEEELERTKDKLTLTLPGRWETNGAVIGSIAELVRFDLDADYWNTYASRVRALTLEQVSNAAQELDDPDQFVWIVVGDLAKIEDGIRALGLGEPKRIDADGEPVAAGR